MNDKVLDPGIGEGLEVGENGVRGSGDASLALVRGHAFRVIAIQFGLGAGLVLREYQPGGEVSAEDVFERAAHGMAVLAQDGELVANVVRGAHAPCRGARAEVAGIGVLGDLPERPALPSPGDQKWWTGTLHRRRSDAQGNCIWERGG